MIVTDIEANGLLDTVSKFHCATIYDYSTNEYTKYRPHDFSAYLDALDAEVARGGLVVFHNGFRYDRKALTILAKKQLDRDFEIPKDQLLDTIVLTKLLWPDLIALDMSLVKKGKLPKQYMKRHSLEAWGYRLGEMKGEYKTDFKKAVEASGDIYRPGDEWLNFNERMMDYCVQDVVVGKALLERCFQNKWYFYKEESDKPTEWERFWDNCQPCVRIEHKAAWLLDIVQDNGYPLNVEFATKFHAQLQAELSKILVELRETFGNWFKPRNHPDAVPFPHPKTGKPLSKYAKVVFPKVGGLFKKPKNKAQREGREPCELDTRPYIKDCPYTPVETVYFNPASPDHLVKILLDAGWKPTIKTKGGGWSTAEDVLVDVVVDDPIAQSKIDIIRKYLVLQKREGMVRSWLEKVGDDGRIHGYIEPNGAGTGRATHSNPNVAQVTKASFDKETHEPLWGEAGKWGCECRYSFGAGWNMKLVDGKLVPDPWVQAGIDASGLELRCLGHFMAPYDGGEYIHTILTGDIHTMNQMAAGLPTRDNAKTFIYGFIYGGGDARIGLIVGGDAKDGKRLKNSFLKKVPAIAKLRDKLQDTLVADSKWIGGEQIVKWKKKHIRGIDNRKVDIRSPHSALNFLLQGAGAVICKVWMIRVEERLVEAGLKHGWDGDFVFMAWVHDEVQYAARTQEIADFIISEAQLAMREVQEMFNFRCQLDTEGKSGSTWMDCH